MKKQLIFNIIIIILLIAQAYFNYMLVGEILENSESILGNADFIEVLSDAVTNNSENINQSIGLMNDITQGQIDFNNTLIDKLK